MVRYGKALLFPLWISLKIVGRRQERWFAGDYQCCKQPVWNGGQTWGETMGYEIAARIGAGVNPEQMHAERVDGFNPLAVIDAYKRKRKIIEEKRSGITGCIDVSLLWTFAFGCFFVSNQRRS